jgi:hypothetical protein
LELLVVLFLVAILGSVALAAFTSLAHHQNASTSAYDIADIFKQARNHALSNNTHVFVAILEEDLAKPLAAPPPRTGIGRVVIAVFESADGTKGFDNSSSPQVSWKAQYQNGRNLRPLGRLRVFDNLHLSASLGTPPAKGAMARPEVNYYYRLGHSSCSSVTPIAWPIGRDLEGGYQYLFEKVVRFDPVGTPRIQYKTNADTIVHWMEIGLQPTHGNQWLGPSPDPNTGNQAAILIDGISGEARIFRP